MKKQVMDIAKGFGLVALVSIGWHYATLPFVLSVPARTETEPFFLSGDRLDDPAVWIHPENLKKSLIVASVKDYGLVVYGVDGKMRQRVPVGAVNNVDIRQGVAYGGGRGTLVAASRVDTNEIEFYTVDADAERIRKLPQKVLKATNRVYGICLGSDLRTDKVSVFVTGRRGHLEQWQIFENEEGLLDGEKVRDIDLDTVTEGCVVDDALGRLYVAEENHGIIRFDVDPATGDRGQWVDRIINGVLKQDVEGLAIYETGPDRGFLIASSQGNNTFVVYDRKTNNLVGRFQVGENPLTRVDEVTGTDGIAVMPFGIADTFPRGFLVVQDDADDDGDRQNLKMVSFQDIIMALDRRPVEHHGPGADGRMLAKNTVD